MAWVPASAMISPLGALDDVRAKVALAVRRLLEEMGEQDPEFLASAVLPSGGASPGAVDGLEQIVGRALPKGFRDVLLNYELGGLEWCGVVFVGEPSFVHFLAEQARNVQPGSVPRFSIAASPGYEILIATDSDSVLAKSTDGPSAAAFVVAINVDRFLRALGTLFLLQTIENESQAAQEVAELVGAPGSSGFWLDRIRGHA